MTQGSNFQDLIRQELEDELKDQQAKKKEQTMIEFFIEASSEEEIQKIERWLLR